MSKQVNKKIRLFPRLNKSNQAEPILKTKPDYKEGDKKTPALTSEQADDNDKLSILFQQ